ncbi:MAG: DUF4350 domain-containing protein [Gemmatimonadaceae bacterium]
MADARFERLLTPRAVLAALVALAVIAYLVTPESELGGSDPELTTHSTHNGGARGLFLVLRQLGWATERRTVPFRQSLDSTAIYLVLDPPIPLSGVEVHELLDGVRRGAGLMVFPVRGTPMADSLRLARSLGAPHALDSDTATKTPEADSIVRGNHLVDVRHHLQKHPWWQSDTADSLADKLSGDTLTLLAALPASREGRHPVVMAMRLGRGRIVIVAEPRLLSNSSLRDSEAGMLTVRLLEWLGAPPTRLVFDEYHHGFGEHTGMTAVVRRLLGDTPPGRVLMQLIIAALLLLGARSARPIAPRARARIERRSPIEHVGALARAYAQIEATPIATRRLVHGLRRRHPLVAHDSAHDEAYLRALSERHPALRNEVDLLIAASNNKRQTDEFLQIARAIASIERTIAR